MVTHTWHVVDIVMPMKQSSVRAQGCFAMIDQIEDHIGPIKINENINMNSNPGDAETQIDDHELPLLQKVKYEMPTPTKSPTCKGDASPDALQQTAGDKLQQLIEKGITKPRAKRKVSKIPVKAKNFKSKSEVSINAVDKALQTLKSASDDMTSKIPVKIKDHKCCNCNLNDFLFNLRLSIRRLKQTEDERIQSFLNRLQEQNSKVSAVSESLKSLKNMEQSLKILQTVSTLGHNGVVFPYSTDVDSAEPIREKPRERPEVRSRWTTIFLQCGLSSLIIVLVVMCRDYLCELLCSDIKPECMLF